jgi:hypothetical protein
MDREWVREHWPFLVGVAIIVVGNVYFYGVLDNEWTIGGPPFAIAILVVLGIELGRALYRRLVDRR